MSVEPITTKRFIESLSTHLEDHLAGWKSSLVDARTEIDALLIKMGERIPAHARPLFPEDLVGFMLEDAMPPAPQPAAPVRIVEKVIERVEVPGPPSAPDWSATRASFALVESARTQVDVLTRFLSQANGHASRVALLVLRNDRLTGWKALGFDATGGRDESVKSIDLAASEDPFAAEVLRRERSMITGVLDPASPLRRALGGDAPARTLLIPMVIRDRLAGLLCADELPGHEGRLNEAALEVLTFVTGLTVDLLAARKKIPSPSLTPAGEEIARYESPEPEPEAADDPGATMSAMSPFSFDAPVSYETVDESPAPAPEPPPAATVSFHSEPAYEAPAAAPAPPAAVPVPAPAPRHRITDPDEALRALEESAAAPRRAESAHARQEFPLSGLPRTPAIPPRTSFEDLGLTTAIPAVQIRPAAPTPISVPLSLATPVAPPPVAPAPASLTTFEHLKAAASPGPREAAPAPKPPVSAPIGDALGAGGPAVSAPMAAPAGFIPRSKMRGGDDAQRAQEDAKRLARLLVSEIKLYNERKLEEGRARGDIFERLRDDIVRSRQVYEERTPETLRQGTNFFNEELVRTLAEGRADALGPMD